MMGAYYYRNIKLHVHLSVKVIIFFPHQCQFIVKYLCVKDKSRQQCKPKQLSVISHCTIVLTLDGKYFCGFIIKGQALKTKHNLSCTSYKAMLLNTSDVNVMKLTT
jgi:hypothetical protein